MKYRELNRRRWRIKKREPRIIGIAALGLVLAACGAPAERADGNPDGWASFDMEMVTGEGDAGEVPKDWPEEHDSCEVQELSGYLHDHIAASPYASAKIIIKGYEGEQLETALNEAAGQETDENAFHFLYYTFPMTENDHALNLYNTLKRKFDTEEHPVTAWSADNGKIFYYIQETIKEEDGYELTYLNSRNSKVNLYVKDRTAYGLTLLNPPPEGDGETPEYVFSDVFQHYGILGSGWGLDKENLYWIDHTERLTEFEDPRRSFLEVRGIDENWEDSGDEGIMRYFGLFLEADYELPHAENGRMLSLHFSLSKEEGEPDSYSDYLYDLRKDLIISAASSLTGREDETPPDEEETPAEEEDTELRYYLLNGYCMDEPYDMTVTDMETGEVLQERRISLSIELPDTITFPDLNGDGYADMRVGAPVHTSGEKAAEESYTPPSYLLWNPLLEQFEHKTEKEVENSRQAVANGLTEGDSLWRISERLYGTGYRWPTIVRAGDAPEDPDYLPVGETVFVPEIFYIRKDPFSRGGLQSEGSFRIEQPNGFAYYFLNGDLTGVPLPSQSV